MAQSLKTVAERLVKAHRKAEPQLERVLYYPDPEGKQVRLVGVVKDSPSADQVYPFRFAPDPEHGIPCPVVLIELSPKEFRRLAQTGENALKLPTGWEESVELFRKAK